MLASPPPPLAGLLEVRGVGILAVPFTSRVPIALVVDLDGVSERLPEPATRDLAGVAVPAIALDAFAASAAIKVERALTRFGGGVET